MSEDDALFATFDAMGEAEVEERLANGAFDHLHEAYALRWLNARSDARLLAAQKRVEDLTRAQALARREDRANTHTAYAIAVAIAVFTLAIASPAIFARKPVAELWRKTQTLVHSGQESLAGTHPAG